MDGTLLYDGDCRFCTTTVGWLQRHATSTAAVVPWQYADLATLGLGDHDCSETVQWVRDGTRAVGPDAVAAYLGTSTGRWQQVGRLLTAPVSRQVAWPLYRFVSHHRTHLPGGTPASQLPRLNPTVRGLRRRRPQDLPRAVRLLRVVHGEDSYPLRWPDRPRDFLDGPDVVDAWVAERQGEILGHVAVSLVTGAGVHWRELTGHAPDEIALVSRLYVRSRVRGSGYGAALLQAASDDIRARGLVPVAEVVSANPSARRLFERQGWTLRSMDAWRDDPSYRLHCFEAPPGSPDRSAPREPR